MWRWKPLMNLVFHHFGVYLCSSRWKVIFLHFLQTKVRLNPASKKTLLSQLLLNRIHLSYSKTCIHTLKKSSSAAVAWLDSAPSVSAWTIADRIHEIATRAVQFRVTHAWLRRVCHPERGQLSSFYKICFLLRLEIGCRLCVGSPQETRTVFSDACGLRRFWLPRRVIMHLCVWVVCFCKGTPGCQKAHLSV